MVTGNLSKASSSLFLSLTRSYTSTPLKKSLKPQTKSLLTSPPLSLSISSPKPNGIKRLFCTNISPNVVEDSSISDIPTKANEEENEDPMWVLKNVANSLEMKVGEVVKAWRHEEADSLYVEEVDVGEVEPRIICSGLVKYMPIDHLQGKKVVVLANLKPRNMRGVKSYGMLMAASDASHENVELLVPPESSIPGERVWFGSEDEKENLPDAASPNQIQKKKIWESVQPHLKTDASGVAALGGTYEMRTSAGVVVSTSLKNANIS